MVAARSARSVGTLMGTPAGGPATRARLPVSSVNPAHFCLMTQLRGEKKGSPSGTPALASGRPSELFCTVGFVCIVFFGYL